jgi:DNA-binding phage protein
VTTRPIPPHGTEARYRGNTSRPPCRCRKCIAGWTKAGQRRQLLRLAGKPASLTQQEVAAVITHIKACIDSGMSQCLIARKAGVAQSTISRLLTQPGTGCLRKQGERLLSVRIADFDARSDRPALGTVRRIRGLYYAGHGPQTISLYVPVSLTMITELAGGEYASVSAATETGVRNACTALAAVPGASSRTRARARREGWAPLTAWDDIDDPNAHPEWTGHCGTDRGWWMHSLNAIPACVRCETAHADWLTERKHLPPAERFRQLALAKGAASNRGATIAADARELMRISGLSYDQAAERLGISRQHLQQELARHPQTEQELAA